MLCFNGQTTYSQRSLESYFLQVEEFLFHKIQWMTVTLLGSNTYWNVNQVRREKTDLKGKNSYSHWFIFRCDFQRNPCVRSFNSSSAKYQWRNGCTWVRNDGFDFFENRRSWHSRPARSLEAQVSIEDRRRSELMNILRNNDSREDVSTWFLFSITRSLFTAFGSMDGSHRREERNGSFDNCKYSKKSIQSTV